MSSTDLVAELRATLKDTRGAYANHRERELEAALERAAERLEAAEKVCAAVENVKASQHGPQFWQCDCGPLEDLDDVFASWKKLKESP